MTSAPSDPFSILYIAAGAGSLRCGACARDIGLVRALRAQGHAVQLMPLYTPLHSEAAMDAEISSTPLFYGGINVYLQQISSHFARVPRLFARWLDHPRLLSLAAGRGVSTQPAELAGLTMSVLRGEEGRLQHELARLIEWLKQQPTPHVINLTNSLLSGLAPALKREINCALVCTVQGEDSFLEAMGAAHLAEARTLMRRNARFIDLFIATSGPHARKMTEFLGVAPARMRTVRPGLDLERYRRSSPRPLSPFTIGYLSVIAPKKGLDLLLDAVNRLVHEQGRDLRLRIAGQVLDPPYWKELRARIRAQHMEDKIEYLGEVSEAEKPAFLQSLSLCALPSRLEEARGMAALESITAGTPVVVPERGAFTEIIEFTQGGLLFSPGDAASLATRIAELMDRPDMAEARMSAAQAAICEKYDAKRAADAIADLYGKVIAGEIRPSETTTLMRKRHSEEG